MLLINSAAEVMLTSVDLEEACNMTLAILTALECIWTTVVVLEVGEEIRGIS